MKKQTFLRAFFYIASLLILAMGIMLNTKSGLGVSAIISVAYSISIISKTNFGNVTFLLYAVFVVAEIILHIIRNRRYSRTANAAVAPAAHRDLKLVIIMDLLQLPLSLVFTRFMNLFSALLPDPSGHIAAQFLFLMYAIFRKSMRHCRPEMRTVSYRILSWVQDLWKEAQISRYLRRKKLHLRGFGQC